MHYWKWLLVEGGWKRFLNWWLVFHFIAAGILVIIVPVSLEKAGNTVLLPLAGILIGMTFAWGGNAHALLQTQEIEKLAAFHPGGIREYTNVYQTAILSMITTLVLWGFAGMGVFDCYWPTTSWPKCYQATEWFLFTGSSITLRECWHVVLGAQELLLARIEIRKTTHEKEKANDNGTQQSSSSGN